MVSIHLSAPAIKLRSLVLHIYGCYPHFEVKGGYKLYKIIECNSNFSICRSGNSFSTRSPKNKVWVFSQSSIQTFFLFNYFHQLCFHTYQQLKSKLEKHNQHNNIRDKCINIVHRENCCNLP